MKEPITVVLKLEYGEFGEIYATEEIRVIVVNSESAVYANVPASEVLDKDGGVDRKKFPFHFEDDGYWEDVDKDHEVKMKPIQEVYPDLDEVYNHYNLMLQSLGFEIVLQESDHGSEGYSWLVLRDGARWGYLTFGWGSCSGCDALQACNTYEELEKLRQDLFRSIKWFDGVEEFREWVQTKNWYVEYSQPSERFFSDLERLLKED